MPTLALINKLLSESHTKYEETPCPFPHPFSNSCSTSSLLACLSACLPANLHVYLSVAYQPLCLSAFPSLVFYFPLSSSFYSFIYVYIFIHFLPHTLSLALDFLFHKYLFSSIHPLCLFHFPFSLPLFRLPTPSLSYPSLVQRSAPLAKNPGALVRISAHRSHGVHPSLLRWFINIYLEKPRS